MLTVSFHSYKGGACRTSTCFNTLPFLVEQLGASAEKPILVLDTDLESQGLTYLFGEGHTFRNRTYDAKELLSGKGMVDFKKVCVPVGDKLGVEKEAVYLLGVNDRKKFDAQNQGGQASEKLSNLENLPFSAIVYDTASGDQFSATITNKASQVIVCCMRPTRQFCTGTFNFLGRVGEEWIMDDDEQLRRVILVPTAVPGKEMWIEGLNQHQETREEIREEINGIEWEICEDFLGEEMFGVPEVERFKWREDVLYRLKKEKKISDEKDALRALECYERLAASIIEEGEKVE